MTDVVTGAFSYTGQAIARLLVAEGGDVWSLSRRQESLPDLPLRVEPLQFADESLLVQSLRGARTLYNTYWIRFPHGGVGFEEAVQNSRTLFRAAGRAGIRRVVHLSVTNASLGSPLPYFRGKAEVEEILAESGLPYAIVRPTLVFGPEDILVNNIAWILRRFPIFLVPGDGRYLLQPVSVEDVARIAVHAAREPGNLTVDAAGPDTLSFEALVRLVAAATGSRARLVHTPPGLALALVTLAGRLLRDVVLTREELDGLRASLLVSRHEPSGADRLGDWVAQNAGSLGTAYVSELARNWREPCTAPRSRST